MDKDEFTYQDLFECLEEQYGVDKEIIENDWIERARDINRSTL